jgi:hypothetical protein
MLMYPEDAEMFSAPSMRSFVVYQDHNLFATMLARKRAIKVGKANNTENLKR